MINELIKNATLSHDKVALNAYKNIKAEFQKVQTAKNYDGNWSEQRELQIIGKYAKSIEDAISQFSEAGRDDLVADYTNELEVVKKLLPAPVNELDIYDLFEEERLSKDYLSKFWEDDGENMNIQIPKKEIGTVIKYLKSKFPTADGKMISEIVKDYIV